ncbi:hypothetical protein R5R35_003538 [Gryllus longicercus]|uniref:Uncharacterized protein n=1 Tax=Gryllus longicercus TaxID=2509291 RepID=A0AAN9Z003_9ORTH
MALRRGGTTPRTAPATTLRKARTVARTASPTASRTPPWPSPAAALCRTPLCERPLRDSLPEWPEHKNIRYRGVHEKAKCP